MIVSIFNLELTPSLKFSSKLSSFIWAFSILISGSKEFGSKREEILSMIWNMEEEIMGKEN